MTARLPRKKARPDRVQLVDMTDGLDLFTPDPDRSHSSRVDAPLPPEHVTAGSPMDETPPELVWLEATDGLEEFAQARDRREASPLMAVPIPQAAVFTASAGQEFADGHPSRFDWVKRASRAALLGSVLAAAADGFLFLQPPATPQPAVVRSEPAIAVPATRDVEATPRPAVTASPPVAPVVVRTAASASPAANDRGGARGSSPTRALRSDARSGSGVTNPARTVAAAAPGPARTARVAAAVVPPARGVATPAGNTTAAAGPRALAPTSIAAAVPAPSPGAGAGASPPAVGGSPAAAPVVDAPARAEPARFASAVEVVAPAAGPPRRELEARAIENVLGRYRNAFNRLDAGAALAVWPTVNEKTLARAFDRLADQDVSFENCEIEIVAVLAEAACSGSARYVPKVGSRTPRAEPRQWRFSLSKASGGWLIDRVDAR